MSAPSTLEELYVEEMQDLWSANDQMTKAVQELSGHVKDPKLKQMLTHSIDGITAHTETIKGLIEKSGGKFKPDHCKGMEGLVTEALKHGVKEAPSKKELQDIEIIAQYQRMSHYGIAGFGSAVRLRQRSRQEGRRDEAQVHRVGYLQGGRVRQHAGSTPGAGLSPDPIRRMDHEARMRCPRGLHVLQLKRCLSGA